MAVLREGVTGQFLAGGSDGAAVEALREAAARMPAGSRMALIQAHGEGCFLAVQVVVTLGAAGRVRAVLADVNECLQRLPAGCGVTLTVRRPWASQSVRLRMHEDGLRREAG